MAKTSSTDIATQNNEIVPWTDEQRQTLARMVARDKKPAPNGTELDIFYEVCRGLNLNPFRGEIIFPDFGQGRQPYPTWKGRLKLASANSPVVRIEGPFFTADGKEWLDVWLDEDHPKAARVELYLRGASWPVIGTATWRTWAQYGDEWIDDPKGAKIEKNGKMVPKRIKTGNKIPIGWWARGAGDYMLGIKAGNLAAELASRVSGEQILTGPLSTTDGGTRKQHKRMWGLVGEIELLLERKMTDDERHEISGVESWSGLDIDSQIEVVHRLEEYLQQLQDEVNGIAEGEVEGVEGSVPSAQSDGSAPTPAAPLSTNAPPVVVEGSPVPAGQRQVEERVEMAAPAPAESPPVPEPERAVTQDQIAEIKAAFADTEDLQPDDDVVDAEIVEEGDGSAPMPTIDQWVTLREYADLLGWTDEEKLAKMAALEGATREEIDAITKTWWGYVEALQAKKKGKPAPKPKAAEPEPEPPAGKPLADQAGGKPALADWAAFAAEIGLKLPNLKAILSERYTVNSLNAVPMDSEPGRWLSEEAMKRPNAVAQGKLA